MSVAAHSPFRGSKRSHHFEQEDQQEGENPHQFSAGKRSRFHAHSPAGGRCTPLSERQAYVVSASTVVALRGLFPEMDEQVRGGVWNVWAGRTTAACNTTRLPRSTQHEICTSLPRRKLLAFSLSLNLRCLVLLNKQTISTVLCECGDNIDSAIRRLNELKLGGAGTAELEQQKQQQAVAGGWCQQD